MVGSSARSGTAAGPDGAGVCGRVALTGPRVDGADGAATPRMKVLSSRLSDRIRGAFTDGLLAQGHGGRQPNGSAARPTAVSEGTTLGHNDQGRRTTPGQRLTCASAEAI